MGKGYRIAVVMDLGGPYSLDYNVLHGILEYVGEQDGWQYEVGKFLPPEKRGGQIDGIVGKVTGPLLENLGWGIGIPAVGLNFACDLSKVLPDEYLIGRMAAEHLISRGLQRLAWFGWARHLGSKLYFEGMREVAREYGYPCEGYWISAKIDDSRSHWLEFINRVTKLQKHWDPPLGIAFENDQLCRTVASVCTKLGWKIPEQLALLGAGNHDVICGAMDPELSSIDINYRKVGYEAAKLLHGLMEGTVEAPTTVLVPPQEVVMRKSTGSFTTGDPDITKALQYMNDHLTEPLPVETIAKAVKIGRQSLERRFKQHLGRSITDALIQMRVEKLMRLLANSTESIKCLYPQVGFGTAVNMHNMFKRHTGMTPHAYRKRHNDSIES